MNISMMVYDGNGRERGNVRMQLSLGTKPQWKLVEDATQVWSRIGFSKLGDAIVQGTTLNILDQQPGKLPATVLTLMNLPLDGNACAGVGKPLSPVDAAFSDGGVYWIREATAYSEIRRAMIDVLNEAVPVPVMSSDDVNFKLLTGMNTRSLLDNFWEPENKVPAWPPDKMPKKNTSFTTCNLTLGVLAGRLGNRLGKPVGRWLKAGVLQLNLADKDVPGCWIEPSSGKKPQPGDFYSVPHILKGGGVQKFGHVGVIFDITEDGMWTSVDGGQGGYESANKKDFIKRVPRGKLDVSYLNGWVDIDLYFQK